jgi:purine-nucleoside phosphorylase
LSDLLRHLDEAVSAISARTPLRPKVGLILGSGLGDIADRLEEPTVIPYPEIPRFPTPKVAGHRGRLVVGKMAGTPIVVMQGRVHFYEGHPMSAVVFPARALVRFGCKLIIVTNAAGSCHESMPPGSLMIIRDHVNLMGENPLVGPNEDGLGTRFPDMTTTYWPDGRALLKEVGQRLGIALHEGVYAAMRGPSYETPAEIEMVRRIGGDAVGMSTVPEVIAIRHMGAKILAISTATNLAAGLSKTELSHADVGAVAAGALDRMSRLLALAVPKLERLLP